MLAHAPSDAPKPPRKDIRFLEFVLLGAALMAMNALSIDPMLPALPDIGRDLRITQPNDRQLIISVYFIGLGIGSLVFGVLSDRFGRKPVLGTALALFILSTIACAVAPGFTLMLVGRACAGFFAGASRVITISIVRDRHSGDAMARVMSLIMAIFMVVPVIAPAFGQVILWFAPWRWIFWVLAAIAMPVLLWMVVRLPETLPSERRLALKPRIIGRTIATVFTIRQSIGYMVASGIVTGGMIGFLVSVQQIVFDVFDAGPLFPLVFALIAGGMGAGSLLNSRLVARFGARPMSHAALAALIAVAIVHMIVIKAGGENIATFIGLMSLTLLTIAFTGANFSAIAMEPFSRGAGTASSFQAFLVTVLSALLGAAIGHAFDGTAMPLALGLLASAVAALLVVLWAERGRLFTRPTVDMIG
ncbi:MAG: multidrug effflux MFS transporter [Sphingobium sp.]